MYKWNIKECAMCFGFSLQIVLKLICALQRPTFTFIIITNLVPMFFFNIGTFVHGLYCTSLEIFVFSVSS